jgi:CheY-like chemotaxis protein
LASRSTASRETLSLDGAGTLPAPFFLLGLATEFSFDAILLDYHMPEMNGHESASEIKRLRPDRRVVRVSGSEIPEEIRQLVDAVVTRKKTARELLPTVARLCRGLVGSATRAHHFER